MGELRKHNGTGRTKEKYNPVPNAKEAAFADFVREQPCLGCGKYGCHAHHVLQRFDGMRWRRDHMYRIPVCPDCHQGRDGIHGMGNERKWADANDVDIEREVKFLTALAITEGRI